MRRAGPEVYDSWVAGPPKWADPEIKEGLRDLSGGGGMDTSTGATTVNTNFGDGGNPLFTDPPGCLFHHQASFITDFFKEQGGAADGDFDFFPCRTSIPTTRRACRVPVTCSACSSTRPRRGIS